MMLPKQRFTLCDEQITVQSQRIINDGPLVASQLTSGYACNQNGCEGAGGSWKWDADNGKYRCYEISSDCHDSGSWDLD